MVDTGASYTIVPAKLLEGLGVEPIDTVRLSLANGRRVEYEIGRALATVDGRTETTLVVFGEDAARPAVGGLHPGGAAAGGGPGEHAAGTRHGLGIAPGEAGREHCRGESGRLAGAHADPNRT